MEDILELLLRNPFREFTVSQLREITDNGSKTTTRAVDLLHQLDLVRVDYSGRSRNVRLHRDRISIPDEPLFRLPQDEFRTPVRAVAERARTTIPVFSALVVFGSVARGEADRRSDVDIWMLIEDDDTILQARRTATDIAVELGEQRFGPDDQRYEFEVLVESVTSAVSQGETDSGLAEILAEGVVIEASDALARVKDVVVNCPAHGGAVLLAAANHGWARSIGAVARLTKTDDERLCAAAWKLRLELGLDVAPAQDGLVADVLDELEAELDEESTDELAQGGHELLELADERTIAPGTPRATAAGAAVYAADRLTSGKALTQTQVARATDGIVPTTKSKIARYSRRLHDAATEQEIDPNESDTQAAAGDD